jgi:serine/threonine protein kinase/tetratricopeptide (TPR) repeat protein
MPLTTGSRIGAYVVVGPLGAGGMGEVYRARDTRLGRDVAIKSLPAPLRADADRLARLLREAQTLATLNHPNIASIYGLEEDGDAPHLVLELVEGETLAARLQREPVPFRELLTTTIQIASAIEAAHERGIVHRDLKPANIMITTSGVAKVLDFGLARDETAPEPSGDLAHSPTLSMPAGATTAGTIVGTLAYMSPEQARGRVVDRRSDVWSFGCILYECLAGTPPFAGETASDLIADILRRDPDWSLLPADAPPRLLDTVRRCLRKEAGERPRDIRDVRLQLEEIAAAGGREASTPGQVSLVVLPFENRGADTEDEYFSDGLTEEVITDLANLEGIRVISRTSAMKLKGTQKDMRTLGRELDVQYVLSGSVRRAGTSLRVNAALVEAETDDQVWAQRFTGSLEDIFEIQEKVALATAEAVKVKLSAQEGAELKSHGIRDPRAYDLYLRARHATEYWTKEGLQRARGYLDAAIEIEPENPVLLAALGYNAYNFVNTGLSQDDMLADALRYAEEALRRDPGSLDAHRLKGVIALSLQGSVRRGIEELQFVLHRSPEDTEAAWWCSLALSFVGRTTEAAELSNRIRKLDPLNSNNRISHAWSVFMGGGFEEALAAIRGEFDREANMFASFSYGQVLIHTGRGEELERLVGKLRAELDSAPLYKLIVAQFHAHKGERAAVEALLDVDLVKTVNRDFQYPWQLAVAWLLLGDRERALPLLSDAVARGFSNYRFLGEHDPYVSRLRGDPRFDALMERARAEVERAR